MRGNKSFSKVQLILALSAILLGSGCGSKSSDNSTPPDTTPPTAPVSLTAVAASDTKVSLLWTTSTDTVGVTGYKINRNGAQIGTSATAVYSDTTCSAATAYTYAVAAYDAAGNTSTLSPSAKTTTLANGNGDISPPSTPVTLTATVTSSTQISLSWGAAIDNVGVSGYNIYRAAASLGPYTKIGTSITTSYTDAGLMASTAYYYVVKAFDGVPNESSAASNEVKATTQ